MRSVDEHLNSGCSLALVNSPAFWPYSDEVTVPGLTPERAKSMHEDVGVALEVRLSPPLLGQFDSRIEPTLNHPMDITYTGDAVFAHLKRVIVFVKSTNEVLRTIDSPQ